MSRKEKISILQECRERGCCERCSIRFAYSNEDSNLASFENPQLIFDEFTVIGSLIELSNIEKFSLQLLGRNEVMKPVTKKEKSDESCITCLGILTDPFIDKMLSNKYVEKLNYFEYEHYILNISLPSCIGIRDLNMRVHLKKIFGASFDDHNVQVKQAWKYTVTNRISRITNKTLNKSSKLSLTFDVVYQFDDEEVRNFLGIEEKCSKTTLLPKLNDKDAIQHFKEKFRGAPNFPKINATLSDVRTYNFIIVAGLYNKYARNLFQKERLNIAMGFFCFSIESIIVNAVKDVLNYGCEVEFQSTLHDDPNDRVLGHGRTFFLYVKNCKCVSLSEEQLESIQEKIERSKAISVRSLREISRRELNDIQQQEQNRHRAVNILCIIFDPTQLDTCIKIINTYSTNSSFNVHQKTPIAKANIATTRIRKRKVFKMEARKVSGRDNLFELTLHTECSLYAREFIHGDLGRTKPSLSDIVNSRVDAIALDKIDENISDVLFHKDNFPRVEEGNLSDVSSDDFNN